MGLHQMDRLVDAADRQYTDRTAGAVDKLHVLRHMATTFAGMARHMFGHSHCWFGLKHSVRK